MLIPFGTQSYQHEARQLSSQRMVNCFLEKQPEGSKAPLAVIRAPGIRSVIELPTHPIRGGINHQGDPYFVSGNSLYKITGSNYTDLGTIPGSGRVDMISNGTQLGILVRSAPSDKNLYVYETTIETVTDDGFTGSVKMIYADLFGVFVKPNSQEFFISDAAATNFPDLREYNALDFGVVEAAPGDIVTMIPTQRELMIFKEEQTEFWTNTGNADFPFQAVGNASMEIGCIAKDSPAKIDNSVFWLANDMTVRRLNGYTPVRISTHAIENAITKLSVRNDAYAFTHPFNGHLFYVLTFPTDNKTFVYDITTGLWHERETEKRDWRPNTYVYADDNHYVGDSLSGKIGILDGSTYTDFTEVHKVSVTSPPVQSEGRQIFFKRLHVDFEMGQGLIGGQGSDPQAMLQWSDDGGKTWSSEYWRPIGKIGEYSKRAVWYRLGSSRDRVFRLTFSDPIPFTMIQAMADVEVGST